eukprot:TRINITY_DN17062_c0_g1_i1.p1 TRINITY_DN17062_c0_g1~~TRINITY_DN17062_c0_g1_i1.p1  ORF type:complete len:494 (-),score=130.42 TRINITY_DN17062_c0_g1_i1:494-1975(-)
MLEVLSDSGLRNVLGFTYVAALLSAVLAVLINQASVDAALELYVLVPLLMISYSSLLLFFLWRCCCTCCCSWSTGCRRVREQVWLVLAIMVALGCTVLLVANEVGRQVLPTAPYITLDVSCRTLWLVLVASYGRERCGCAFYVYKMLFAAANIAVLFVVQHKTEHEWASRAFYLAWAIWLLVSIERTSDALAELPYVETRIRQLGFRFFCWQSGVVILTQGSIIAYDCIQGRRSHFALSLMLHSTVMLQAFVHLPAPRQQQQHTFAADTAPADELTGLVQPTSPRRSQFDLTAAAAAFQLCWEAYYDNPFEEPQRWSEAWPLATDPESGKGATVIDVIQNSETDTQCVGLKWHDTGALLLGFRGTQSVTNIATDIDIRRVHPKTAQGKEWPHQNDRLPSWHRIAVHTGFWNAYWSVRAEMIKLVEAVGDDVPVVCCGHSLGGALSTLAALEIAALRRKRSTTGYGSTGVVGRSSASVVCFTFGWLCTSGADAP